VGFTESILIEASRDPKMRKQGGKQKHITLMTPQKLEVIRRLESGKSLNVQFTLHITLDNQLFII